MAECYWWFPLSFLTNDPWDVREVPLPRIKSGWGNSALPSPYGVDPAPPYINGFGYNNAKTKQSAIPLTNQKGQTSHSITFIPSVDTQAVISEIYFFSRINVTMPINFRGREYSKNWLICHCSPFKEAQPRLQQHCYFIHFGRSLILFI